ncbi:hypothetical protein BDV32DRAFT_160224 [Aspergillus pseudonomiae]|uniref:Uncharacterized protein n=1 Tax=Aspergillus pseudonomiae TaxID=1506151 RepID=A0A5N6IEF1_9EURO|nr:uncharacterized protein BDV37DRAFT_273975 [Aspergillus pseudonomiae]KAB8264818.1 hypothetical protein BDV32DRAFT_160224 [Aspergillus pseudonomiae]KAE8400962.1 hypothetical protein BDV37DRAFT_273975 [Aspergillus pseudonomiae]
MSTIPYLAVPSLTHASQRTHINAVHHILENEGILHVQLGFPDDKSSYIQELLLNLHKTHNHGLPLTHSADRGWMWDIRPSLEMFQSNNHQARSETMEQFPWHTDCSYEGQPPRFFALQVLQPDQCGGGTLSVLNVPPEFVKNPNEKAIIGNLLTMNANGKTQLRFREDITSALCSEAAEALREFKCVLGAATKRQILNLTAERLPRGSIIMMDNGRWLHARNEVKDPNRHLRRVRWDAREFANPPQLGR